MFWRAQSAGVAAARSCPSPASLFASLVACGSLRGGDPAQLAAVSKLSTMHAELLAGRVPGRGLYLHGRPGRGKTLLAGLLRAPGVTHVHYSRFLLSIDAALHALRGRPDPLDAVAEQLASTCRVLALDELDVTDVAQAAITQRLYAALLTRRVRLVATSNRSPEDLYKNGLNRSTVFAPFVAALRATCDVISLDGDEDLRVRHGESPVLFHETSGDGGKEGRAAVDAAWRSLVATQGAGAPPPCAAAVPVPGAARSVAVPLACGSACRFSFSELCAAPLSPNDFNALCGAYEAFVVDDVPRLGSSARDALSRWVAFLDATYERRKLIVVGARVPIGDVFEGAGGAPRDVSVYGEPRQPGSHPPPPGALAVSGEGGSSGRSTTRFVGERGVVVECVLQFPRAFSLGN